MNTVMNIWVQQNVEISSLAVDLLAFQEELAPWN